MRADLAIAAKPGWSEWHIMPGPSAGKLRAIAAGSHDDRHQELFAVGVDGSVHHRWCWLGGDGEASWSDWHRVPDPA